MDRTPIGDAVRSIRSQQHRDWELIVVAQGEDPLLDRELGTALDDEPRARVIRLRQKGASLARNVGIQASDAEVVALMDDDCEARCDWLSVLETTFEAHPDLDLVGGALIAPPILPHALATCPQSSPHETVYVPRGRGAEAPPGFVVLSANLALTRRAIEAIGGFDEELGPGTPFPAAEDPDLVIRLEARRAKMCSTPRAVVVHTHGARYGLRASHRILKGYARGQGALAAKLTLMGDPRGRRRLQRAWTDIGMCARRSPHNALRALYWSRAYRRCMRDYELDESGEMLRPRSGCAEE